MNLYIYKTQVEIINIKNIITFTYLFLKTLEYFLLIIT